MSLVVALAIAAGAPGFAAIAPLIGHCWRGTLPDGGVDMHCFVRVRGGELVRDRHVVRRQGKAVYRGETAYTAGPDGLRWAYRNASGPVMAGGVSAAADELRFTVDGGPPLVWRWQGARAYVAQVGPTAAAVTFRRVR